MKSQTILVVDDDDAFRSTVVEFLKRRHYTVIEAATIPEARDKLQNEDLDLAVIDIRMQDHKDSNDDSGMRLAVETAPYITKIMLTAYPTPELVRTALRRLGGRLPAAVDFLDKADGLEVLLDVIKKNLPQRDIFIVHGHDEAAKLKVENFLTKLRLNPIVLHELPHAGQIILEKLENAAHVNYAIVLLTPDDLGGMKNGGGDSELRARQNVILELGYFMGKLGRQRVSTLYAEGVVLPSDIAGLGWILLDPEGAWKIALARELRAANILFDPNNIL